MRIKISVFVTVLAVVAALFIPFAVLCRSKSLSDDTVSRTQLQLQSSDILVQLEALHFLSEHPPSPVLREDVERLARSSDSRVRAYAIRTISRYQDQEALYLAESLENDPDELVSETARHYLYNLRRHVRRAQD